MSKEAFAAVVEMAVSGRTDRLAALLHDAGTSADAVRSEIVRTAEYHLVAPLVGDALRAAPVDVAMAEYFARSQRVAFARHLRFLGDLQWTARVLDDIGVAWAVLKGPFLVEHAYKQPNLRRYGDLDVLVDRHRFGDVLDALVGAGAVLRDGNWPMIADSVRGELSVIVPGGSLLDLHWHLIVDEPVRRGFRIDIDDVLSRRRFIDVPDGPLPALEAGDAFFHTATHAVLSGADRLLWFIDLARLAAVDDSPQRSDWERAERFGWAGVGAAAVDRVNSVVEPARRIDTPIRSSVHYALKPTVAFGGLNRSIDARFTGHLLAKSARRNLATTATALGRALVDQAVKGPLTNPDHPWRTRGGNKMARRSDIAESPLKQHVDSARDRTRFLGAISV